MYHSARANPHRPAMSYREYSPPAALAGIIECVWTHVPAPGIDASSGQERQASERVILPDGAMDIIATFFDDGDVEETFAVGAMTGPQLATVGNQAIIGVRFLPGAGGTGIGINASTVTDAHADLRDLTTRMHDVRDAFRALRLNASSAHALHLFASSMGLENRAVPSVVRESAKLLAQTASPVRVEDVAQQLRISRQHLRRVFTQHSGLSPKLFAQICRVRALLATAGQRNGNGNGRVSAARERRLVPSDRWSMLAAQFGYTDQSHMIAEVRAVIGQTPAEWAKAGSNIPILPAPVGAL